MSLFKESAWEANAVGDKLSNEIFQTKNRSAPNYGKRKLPKSVRKLNEDKLTTKHAKRRAKKRKQAILEAVATGVFPPKKWERKPKVCVKPEEESNIKTEQQSQSNPAENNAVQETRSQKKRRKEKLKKMAGKMENDNGAQMSNVPSSLGEKLPLANSDIQKLREALAIKDKSASKSEEPETLRERMMTQLRASRFRFLNETLYNNDSSDSKKFFKEDPEAFDAYHAGYRQQVETWPINPLDVIITSINKMPKDYIIADFGCGEARLAESVSQKVHSFDLIAVNDKVKACDMAHTPLLTNGVNVVVFCLSLMGTNLQDYLLEANRVLKKDGILKIADVESRFENVDEFIQLLKNYGFTNTWKDLSHNLFYFMDFKKFTDVNRGTKNLPQISLKTCLYKKR